MLNKESTETFWYIDEKSMILEKAWGDGRGDALGRNAFTYICHPNELWLKDSIMACIKQRDDSFVQFYRYPDLGADSVSRDHVGAVILAFYINNDRTELEWILKNLPFRLSRKYVQTLDFWLWQKSLLNDNRWYQAAFHLLNILMFLFIIPHNFIIRKLFGIKKIKDVDNWKTKKLPNIVKSIYPHYALFLLAWQVRITKDSLLKWILQKILLIESSNIVIDAVLGKPITSEYKPTLPFIWSRRMDVADNIEIRTMTEKEAAYNDLNKAMYDYLRLGLDKIMIEYPKELTQKIKSVIWY